MKRSTHVAAWFVAILGFAAVAPSLRADVDFYRDVYPFLKANCISCHNKTTTKAGLNMETPEWMLEGGDSGPAIVPGDGAGSLLVKASRHAIDVEMPPKKNKTGAVKLTPEEIATMAQWIDEGAKSSVQAERIVVFRPLTHGVHPIYSLAVSNEGRYAACGRSTEIFLYDLAARRLQTRIGKGGAHRGLVHALAFSPDGKRLASGSYREVKIWRKLSGQGTSRPGDAALGLVVAQLSPDGRQIVGVDRTGDLLILDAGNGRLIRKIAGAGPGGIERIRLSPDGTRAALLELGGRLSVWSLGESALLHGRDTAFMVNALTWTADGKSVVTGGSDRIVRLWTLPEPGVVALPDPVELQGATGAVTALAAGPAADRLLAAGADGKVRLWNLPDAVVVYEIPAAGVAAMALSVDGTQLATGGSDGVIRLWDAATGKALGTLQGSVELDGKIAEMERAVARFTLEQAYQKTVVTAIGARTKALDELLKKAEDAIVAMNKKLPALEEAIAPLREARIAAEKVVAEAETALAAAPDESAKEKARIVAADKLITARTKEDDAIAALEAAKSNIVDAEAQVKRITASQARNAEELAAAEAAIEAAVRSQAAANTELAAAKSARAKPSAMPLAVAFSSDAARVAATFDDGSIRVWAVATGTPVEEAGGAAAATSLVFREDGAFAACRFDSTFATTAAASPWVLERTLGGETDPGLFADRVNALRFSPDGATLATGSGEASRTGDVILFDTSTGKPTATWKEHHADSVLCLDFSPDGKLLASGAADKIARVTEVATGRPVNQFEGHTHYVTGVSFRGDGRVLATAGADGVVNAWDLIRGERKKKIEGWTKEVTSLQFIGATNQIVTSAGDNLIRIVTDDGAQVRAIAKLPDFMQVSAATPGGGTILGGGEDSFLRLWNGADGKEIAAFGTP